MLRARCWSSSLSSLFNFERVKRTLMYLVAFYSMILSKPETLSQKKYEQPLKLYKLELSSWISFWNHPFLGSPSVEQYLHASEKNIEVVMANHIVPKLAREESDQQLFTTED